jgi:hypothetical protein
MVSAPRRPYKTSVHANLPALLLCVRMLLWTLRLYTWLVLLSSSTLGRHSMVQGRGGPPVATRGRGRFTYQPEGRGSRGDSEPERWQMGDEREGGRGGGGQGARSRSHSRSYSSDRSAGLDSKASWSHFPLISPSWPLSVPPLLVGRAQAAWVAVLDSGGLLRRVTFATAAGVELVGRASAPCESRAGDSPLPPVPPSSLWPPSSQSIRRTRAPP